MATNEKIKCNRCKVLLLPEKFNVKRSGDYMKNCIECNRKNAEYAKTQKCEHGKRKQSCKECKGGSICEHGKRRETCKECKGGSICEHGKIKQSCKECKGVSICEHSKVRSICKECKGGAICEHSKVRSICKECKGGALCEHSKVRSICKECKGGAICEHNKLRSVCKECKGGAICEHSKIRSICKECKGGSICEHSKVRSTCKECSPSGHLGGLIRSHVRRALKDNKTKHSIEYLGCTVEEFRKHIEEKFDEKMTWENYGEWHIDHIVPIKYKENGEVPSIEQVIERLHYLNTQPMWAFENISKGNRYIG